MSCVARVLVNINTIDITCGLIILRQQERLVVHEGRQDRQEDEAEGADDVESLDLGRAHASTLEVHVLDRPHRHLHALAALLRQGALWQGIRQGARQYSDRLVSGRCDLGIIPCACGMCVCRCACARVAIIMDE